MQNTNGNPSRQELVQAGKLEERHAVRRPSIIPKEEIIDEPDKDVRRLRPELLAIAILVVVLIVLTLIGF